MKHGLPAAALALVLGWFYAPTAQAQAQLVPDLSAYNIQVDYYAPRNAAFQPLYEKLKKRKVLEELGQFLAPVKWPTALRLIAKQCPSSGVPTPEVFYTDIEYSLTVCYQWFSFLESLHPPASFATRQEVVVGGLVGAVLHEAARAAFDMLQVPRLGSDEDAADQLAGFIGLQFGKDVARTVIKGTYYVFDTYDYEIRANNRQYNFADKSSVAPQRADNILCIAYGGDPADFKDFVAKGLLNRVIARNRAEHCADEYSQVGKAFSMTIAPKVDEAMMKKVLSLTWITPDDLK